MLRGYFLIIYIHNRLALPKLIPERANCQLSNADFQNSTFHPNGSIFIRPIFRKTWPKARIALWTMASRNKPYVERFNNSVLFTTDLLPFFMF